MSGIEFEGDNNTSSKFVSRTVLGAPQIPSMASWLMKKGIIKEESQSGKILIAIICINFIVAGLVIYFFVL